MAICNSGGGRIHAWAGSLCAEVVATAQIVGGDVVPAETEENKC